MITTSELTLGAAKASALSNIAGVCVEKTTFVQLLNDATERLMTYGNFWGTVVKGRVCSYNHCISWPRWVGTLLSTNLGNQSRPIANKWYDFMPLTAGDCMAGRNCSSNVTVVDDGMSPVFANVPCGTPMFVRIYTRFLADAGKTVTLYGIDEFGQELMTKDSMGNWYQGVTVTLAVPYVQTLAKFREITRVSKDVTTGMIDVYAVDGTGQLLDMAHYEPSEIEPKYRHTSIRGMHMGVRGASNCSKQITFLAKLKHIPVSIDTDIVQIDNIHALKLMIQAVRLEEAGDDDGANKKQAMAIKELNRQLADKLPLNQIPVVVAPFGTALPSHHRIGLIM